MSSLKNKVDDSMHGSPRVTMERTAPGAEAPATPPSSLGEIINGDLQRGRYAEGERALRQYLAAHPGDRAAQALLHQLTVDPAHELGTRSRNYMVQSGDSYSTLAARYLGDAQRFVILARYNGSADPSMLRAGQTLRLPLGATSPGPAAPAPVPAADASVDIVAPATSVAPATANAPAESATAKASRLQRESVALLAQGHKDQALAQLDEALSLDPHLKSSDPQAAAMRQQLLAAYHQRAIVLYRDQKLDPAIALWDHVLAIDPSYEPAVIYRARALELKQRLKQF
ncbi:LysM peptidoglycan-binding domain-containing protein [Rhodanobacter sp. DHB23]|uniref:LysM peptidoglycan-binding domain-containing protein n=1 Tax=Rhodanobacter sp. DHB23 TaxID=2775923 RepID=UPI00177C142E|nr:LysM peptidoglycan-binding domain-containing protein [Rhodanobacter sp. DHB23]MBD8873605.1 LysM peptidoglycan-binding domain-containing protein [Rhodanobacter sp. DHB23]